MTKEKKIRNFLTNYESHTQEILIPYYKEVMTCLEEWKKTDFWAKYAIRSESPYPSPIKNILIRIKRPEKVVDKIFRKPDEYPDGLSIKSFLKMDDRIGVRIIIYFLSQFPFIDREFKKSTLFEFSKTHKPEAYLDKEQLKRFGLSNIGHKHKDSGYASIHYVIRLKKSSIPLENRPWFEVQVRTLAQELWSEMEHILAYKSEKRTNLASKRRFQILSKEINAIDEHFNLLYEELFQNQEVQPYNNNDILGVENLQLVLSEIGLRCAQQDFHTILNILFSRGIKTTGDFKSLATLERIENIHNTYISMTGNPPTNFELIASLASIYGITKRKKEKENISFHIEYSKVWNKIRKTVLNNPFDKEGFFK